LSQKHGDLFQPADLKTIKKVHFIEYFGINPHQQSKKMESKKRIGDQKTTDSNHCQARHIIT
jgi:hypothetical protein